MYCHNLIENPKSVVQDFQAGPTFHRTSGYCLHLAQQLQGIPNVLSQVFLMPLLYVWKSYLCRRLMF